jgi:hypothetical protein
MLYTVTSNRQKKKGVLVCLHVIFICLWICGKKCFSDFVCSPHLTILSPTSHDYQLFVFFHAGVALFVPVIRREVGREIERSCGTGFIVVRCVVKDSRCSKEMLEVRATLARRCPRKRKCDNILDIGYWIFGLGSVVLVLWFRLPF